MFIGAKSKDTSTQHPYYRMTRATAEQLPNSGLNSPEAEYSGTDHHLPRVSVDDEEANGSVISSPKFTNDEARFTLNLKETVSRFQRSTSTANKKKQSTFPSRQEGFSSMAAPSGGAFSKTGRSQTPSSQAPVVAAGRSRSKSREQLPSENDTGTQIDVGDEEDRFFFQKFQEEQNPSQIDQSHMSLRKANPNDVSQNLDQSEINFVRNQDSSQDQKSSGFTFEHPAKARHVSAADKNDIFGHDTLNPDHSEVESVMTEAHLQSNQKSRANSIHSSRKSSHQRPRSPRHLSSFGVQNDEDDEFQRKLQLAESKISSTSFVKVKESFKTSFQRNKESIYQSQTSRRGSPGKDSESESEFMESGILKLRKNKSLFEAYGLQGQNIDQDGNDSQSSLAESSDSDRSKDNFQKLVSGREKDNYYQLKAHWIQDPTKFILVDIQRTQTIRYLQKKVGERMEEQHYDFFGLRHCEAKYIMADTHNNAKHEDQSITQTSMVSRNTSTKSKLQFKFRRGEEPPRMGEQRVLREDQLIKDCLKSTDVIYFDIDSIDLWLNIEVSINLEAQKVIRSSAQIKVSKHSTLGNLKRKLQIFAVNLWVKKQNPNDIDEEEEAEVSIVEDKRQVKFDPKESMIDERSDESDDISEEEGLPKGSTYMVVRKKLSQLSMGGAEVAKAAKLFNSNEELGSNKSDRLKSQKKKAVNSQQLYYKIKSLSLKSLLTKEEQQQLTNDNSNSTNRNDFRRSDATSMFSGATATTMNFDQMEDSEPLGNIFEFKNKLGVEIRLAPFIVTNFQTGELNVQPQPVIVQELIEDFLRLKTDIARKFGEEEELRKLGRTQSEINFETSQISNVGVSQNIIASKLPTRLSNISEVSGRSDNEKMLDGHTSAMDASGTERLGRESAFFPNPDGSTFQDRSQMQLQIVEDINHQFNSLISSQRETKSIKPDTGYRGASFSPADADPEIAGLIRIIGKFVDQPSLERFNSFSATFFKALNDRLIEAYYQSDIQFNNRGYSVVQRHDRSSLTVSDAQFKSPLLMKRDAAPPPLVHAPTMDVREENPDLEAGGTNYHRTHSSVIGKHEHNSALQKISKLIGFQRDNRDREEADPVRQKSNGFLREAPKEVQEIKHLFNQMKEKIQRLYLSHLQYRHERILEFLEGQSYQNVIMGSIYPEVNAQLNRITTLLVQSRNDLVQAKILLVQKKIDQDGSGKPGGSDHHSSKPKRMQLFGRNRQNTTKGAQPGGISDIKSPIYSQSTVSQVVKRPSDIRLQGSKQNSSSQEESLARSGRSKSNQNVDIDKIRSTGSQVFTFEQKRKDSSRSPTAMRKHPSSQESHYFQMMISQNSNSEKSKRENFSFGGTNNNLKASKKQGGSSPMAKKDGQASGKRKSLNPFKKMESPARSFEEGLLPQSPNPSNEDRSSVKKQQRFKSFFKRMGKKHSDMDVNSMTFNPKPFGGFEESLDNSTRQINPLSASDSDVKQSFHARGNSPSNRDASDFIGSPPKRSLVDMDFPLKEDPNLSNIENMLQKVVIPQTLDPTLQLEVVFLKNPLNDMSVANIVTLINILQQIQVLCPVTEAYKEPKKKPPAMNAPKNDNSPASPASIPQPSDQGKVEEDEATCPFSVRHLMLEEYLDMKMPLVRKFEMGVNGDLQSFARQMAFSLLRGTQERYLSSTILSKLQPANMVCQRPRKPNLVTLSFQSTSQIAPPPSHHAVKLPSQATVDESVLQQILYMKDQQNGGVNPQSFFSQARFLKQIEEELFPRVVDEGSQASSGSVIQAYFGPVAGLEGLLKSPSLMMNFNSHIAGSGQMGGEYLTASQINKMEHLSINEKLVLISKMDQKKKELQQKRRQERRSQMIHIGIWAILIGSLAFLLYLLVTTVHAEQK